MWVAPRNKPNKAKFAYVDFINTDDKPFLSKVYEKLQFLVEGTRPRIEKDKADTIQKLIKEGKIKA